MENKELQTISLLARGLQSYYTAMIKKICIFLISLSSSSILFLYPFSVLQDDYISAAPLIGQEKEIILSEPAILLLLGSLLTGLGLYARKKFKKAY